MAVNEWSFAGEIKSWWDAEIASSKDHLLGEVRIEDSLEGDSRRADITLRDSAGSNLLVLELRLPDHRTPDAHDVLNIQNAASKASAMGARWSATSDAKEFVLFDHSKHDQRLKNRGVPVRPLTHAATRTNLDIPAEKTKIRESWVELLRAISPILTDQERAPTVAPDEFFVDTLRATLRRPLTATRDAISRLKDEDSAFHDNLISWIVDEQGWTHSREAFEQEVERVAELATYVFATRLLFYGALRRAQPDIPELELPDSGNPRLALSSITSLFEQAREVTRDYETVFRIDDVTRWALIDSAACLGWGKVIAFLDEFQLEAITYDVLGKLFERLIDPDERYAWGQHYTSPDVVDLMLSTSIRDGSESIADFACGGGTFLVRAYTRKKLLDPNGDHDSRLRQIFGGDISAFATSLSTISLASQHLAAGANYPQVRIGSFFKAFSDNPYVSLPEPEKGTSERYVPPLDSVVCNPPYISHSDAGEVRRSEALNAYRRDWPSLPRLRDKWNYHLPFWWHSASFLRPGGTLAFITSGEWLDADYGAQLQDWLLQNFHIELVIESMAEQWFTDARVGTVVVIARRNGPAVDREQQRTRFITLRKPLSEAYGAGLADDAIRMERVDAFRDRLLKSEGSGTTEEFTFTTVRQRDLVDQGTFDGRYSGTPWRSRYLRTPTFFRKIDSDPNWIALHDIAEVKLGTKTGADDFFFLKPRGRSTTGRVQLYGAKNWSGELAKTHIRPALRGPKDLDTDTGRRFVVPARRALSYYFSPPRGSRGADLQQYIDHGEMLGVNKKRLVLSNASDTWFRQERSLIDSPWVLPYNSAYDYFAADNRDARAVLNGRLLGVTPHDDVESALLGAVLNSTFTLAARLLVGVQTGSEGAFDVGPPAAKVMRIPNPRNFDSSSKGRVREALHAIVESDQIPPAPNMAGSVDPLRRELDLSILVALGSSEGQAAIVLDQLYDSYAQWRKAVRAVELEVQENRRKLSARGGARREDPVARAARELLDNHRATFTDVLTPLGALKAPDFAWVDAVAPAPEQQDSLLARTTVAIRDSSEVADLGHPGRVDFVRAIRGIGVEGSIPIPPASTADHVATALFNAESDLRKAALSSASRISSGSQASRIADRVLSLWRSEQGDRLRRLVPRVESDESSLSADFAQSSILDPDGLTPTYPNDA